jgi:uncharacterized integral membrane protein (TIGR00697 family)
MNVYRWLDRMNNNSAHQHSNLFLYLCLAFVCCLLLSNLITGKLMQVGGIVFTAGLIIFPLTYILGNVFTEVYGFSTARRIIWIGFICNFFAVAVYLATLALPYPEYWQHQSAYAIVLGITPRIFIASIVAYLIGSFLNAMVLSKLKVLMRGKWLWCRTISSSIIGYALDSTVFITVAFWDIYETSIIGQMIFSTFIWKISYEILLTPAVCVLIIRIKKTENVDVYDIGEKYNPFRFKNK